MEKNNVKKMNRRYVFPLLHYDQLNCNRHFEKFPDIPWHWHDEYEIMYVKSGIVIYKLNDREIKLTQGDIIFVNAKVVHTFVGLEPMNELCYSIYFFDNSFLAGADGNLIDTKYISPIQKKEDLDVFVFSGNNQRMDHMRYLLDKCYELWHEKSFFYELFLRKNIGDLWCEIFQVVNQMDVQSYTAPVKNVRLKHATVFIRNNYKEKIKLEDIAAYVNISVRECNRMFIKHLNVSPMNYLEDYRMEKATGMLMDTDKSITQIALENGFSSGGYFSKRFKEHHGITPMEYRRNIADV